jgi:hypothetical protein
MKTKTEHLKTSDSYDVIYDIGYNIHGEKIITPIVTVTRECDRRWDGNSNKPRDTRHLSYKRR